jgi:energy-coupling factor transport system substrate-specific component
MVVIAALGAVFGVFYLGWIQVWIVSQGIFGPLATDFLLGFWFIVSIIAAYIIRKPFVAFTAEVVAAIVELLLGAPGGLILVLSGAIQGAGAELPFALTKWRNYRLPVLLAAGASAAVFSFVYNWVRFGYATYAPLLLIAMFAIRVLSGIVLAGLLGRFIGDRLHKTGVLSGLAIDNDDLAARGAVAGR